MLLGVDWGRIQPLPPGKLGTFHELWLLRWRPEMVLQIVSAAVYGNTLLEAATARVVERAERTVELGSTAELVQQSLLADLEHAVARLVSLLSSRSAEATDVSQLLRALPPLAATLRYGDVRRTDAAALAGVIRGLAERATVGLAPATLGLDDDAADALASPDRRGHACAQPARRAGPRGCRGRLVDCAARADGPGYNDAA